MTATVIIPTLDEIAHIGGLLSQFLGEPTAIVGEILVADGGSRDGTRDVVSSFARRSQRVRLIDNPDRIQSAGVNRAVAAADPRFDIFVRIDAHALYPADYVARLLASLKATDADMVVVVLTTRGNGNFQRAVAVAQNSRAGTGGSAHRISSNSCWVDHGHHAAFRRATFEEADGYDIGFVANEDAELDVRIRGLGGRIWLDATIPVIYFPRSTITGLARQYFNYGSGRARNSLKHKERLRLRQMLPPAVVLTLVLSLVGSLLEPAMLTAPLIYVIGLLAVSFPQVIRSRSGVGFLAAPILATMHFAWGAGFLRQMAFRTKPVRSHYVPQS